MARVRQLLIVITHSRIREAVSAVLGAGMGIYGLMMFLFPERHTTPTMERAVEWGGLTFWGIVLFVAGSAVVTSLPWHETAAPAIPLAVLSLALILFVVATGTAAAEGNGTPGAPWLFGTVGAISVIMSFSYSLGLMVENQVDRPPVRTSRA